MIRIIAEVYSYVHRVIIVLGTVAIAVIGGVLGHNFWHEINAAAYALFNWKLTQENSTFLGVIVGLIVAFSIYGREAMILETYKTSKNASDKLAR